MPGILLTGFKESCQALGLDSKALFEAHQISPESEGVLLARIRPERVVALLEDAATQAAEPAFGLMVGSHWDLKRIGPLALLLLEARNLRDFFARLDRYAEGLNQAVRYQLTVDGPEASIQAVLQLPELSHSLPLIELLAARSLTVFRAILGSDWSPKGVLFQHSPQLPRQRYEKILRAPVMFEAEMDGLALAPADVEKPIVVSDDQISTAVNSYLDPMFLAEQPRLSDQVTRLMMLLFKAGQPVTLQAVAQMLAVPARTLQYQLRQNGVSFRALLIDVQSQLARNMLMQQRASVAEVSQMLGFSETSAFSRAFKRWHGVAPSKLQ